MINYCRCLLSSLLIVTKLPFSNSYNSEPNIINVNLWLSAVSCMKIFMKVASQRYTHPVATLYQSTETGNSSTPPRLLLGNTHTREQDIDCKVMTTVTMMTKLLTGLCYCFGPKRHYSPSPKDVVSIRISIIL
jgi:hypothetical protein